MILQAIAKSVHLREDLNVARDGMACCASGGQPLEVEIGTG